MSPRALVLAVALVAVLGIAGLLVAAGNDGRSTAFSLDIPPSGAVTTLHKGQEGLPGPAHRDRCVRLGDALDLPSPSRRARSHRGRLQAPRST